MQTLREVPTHMNRRNVISSLIFVVLFSITGLADEKLSFEREINALIQRLVSDHVPQKRKLDAWIQLRNLGLQAFPYLIDHFDDERDSFRADAGDDDRTWSIGLACSDIVKCQIQPFGPFSRSNTGSGGRGPVRPSYMKYHSLRKSADATAWWETRKSRSLRELQIEVLEWTLAEEAKTPARYSEEEREYLDGLLGKLRNGDAPLSPTVPWAK